MSIADLRAALARALDRLDHLDATGPAVDPGAVASVRAVLRGELDRLEGDGPLTGWTAASLAQTISDGGGALDPGHPLLLAFTEVEAARERAALATGRIPLLDRVTVRQIVLSDERSRGPIVTAASSWGVLVPTIVEGETQSFVLVRGGDGVPFVVCFTDRELFDRWAVTETRTARASITTLATLRSHAQAMGVAGVVVNPWNDDLAIPGPLPQPRRLSFGAPSRRLPDVEGALRSATIAGHGIAGVHLAAVVDGDRPARLVAVVDAPLGDDVRRFAEAVGSALGAGHDIDVLDAQSDLGRAIAADIPSLLELSVDLAQPRDRRAPQGYWALDEPAARKAMEAHAARVARPAQTARDRSTVGFEASFLEVASWAWFRCRYSGGIPRSQLAADFLTVVDMWQLAAPIMARHLTPRRVESLDHGATGKHRYAQRLWFVSSALAFDVDESTFARVVDLVRPAFGDRVLDRLVATRLPSHPLGDTFVRRGAVERLDRVWDAADRPAALRRYLDDWYTSWHPMPRLGTHDTLEALRYHGYWAFEAAGVVAALGIDDASFRDHEFYPADLLPRS